MATEEELVAKIEKYEGVLEQGKLMDFPQVIEKATKKIEETKKALAVKFYKSFHNHVPYK